MNHTTNTIRVIRRNKYFFFSVNDYFETLVKIGLIKKKPSYRWNFLQSLYKKWYEGFKKNEVDNGNLIEFIQFDFADVFIRNHNSYKIVENLPKEIRENPIMKSFCLRVDEIDCNQIDIQNLPKFPFSLKAEINNHKIIFEYILDC